MLATASVVVLAWQFVTAAGLFTGGAVGRTASARSCSTWSRAGHGGRGVAAGGHRRAVVADGPGRRGLRDFTCQAWFGEIPGLIVHVPGAMALVAGSVWLTAWSFLRAR
ncbi:hypothetical protein [Pseudonocardia sp. ICBG1293]|uniref:hypothetical protein n=1 Tax=Pseudonocardia sp. ICBG1293 TaxID=2844382 RepID=UPI001CCB8508|nr:hypothetical protein [Pseudonocardia sp. ICBG1293]